MVNAKRLAMRGRVLDSLLQTVDTSGEHDIDAAYQFYIEKYPGHHRPARIFFARISGSYLEKERTKREEWAYAETRRHQNDVYHPQYVYTEQDSRRHHENTRQGPQNADGPVIPVNGQNGEASIQRPEGEFGFMQDGVGLHNARIIIELLNEIQNRRSWIE
ncbi:hypothetical protein QAD02_013551 [Eretmocerus hayati]|uniref:Uncharacterized protein n=1 Tax=Eretmocerus hayati TaxID=131215 RepID=A0ACC2P5F3_9HYME|nr:hypothetical protein QAD02_013551 [Eretmocerus hayati]